MKQPAIYILTNKKNGTLYVGVTSDLEKRMYQHTHTVYPGFAQKYSCKILVYYELFTSMIDAISTEKRLKNKSRKKKIELIETHNTTWSDLYK